MSVDLEVIQGFIQLKDDFTSRIGIAEQAISKFSDENQKSLLAVAGFAGIAAAAVGAAAAAVITLGNRGADVNDVAATLEHFAGSAADAEAILAALRAGTQGTIDNFVLMKDAAHLLSAGVTLNAADFGTLGEAAFVLQNRGLGGTKEMMELVSDALVTGRTRALAMAVGVVDVTDAQEKYAESLGITKDQLSDSGVVEAKRLAVMEIMKNAVKDAGVQTRDFGEQIEFAKTSVTNWVDSVGQAIATSPALEAGMRVVADAIQDAFGGGSQESIDAALELIKKGAVLVVDFGLGMVEMARVANVVWSAVKVVILGVEAVMVGMVAGLASGVAAILEVAASVPGASTGLKAMAASAADVANNFGDMTISLVKDTAEAAKGVTGHSEFDATLDHLGGTLYSVRDAINGAAAAADKNNQTVDVAAKNAAMLAKLQKELETSMVDRGKVEAELWKVEEKSLKETTALWNEYYKLHAQNGLTSFESDKQAIQSWFDDEVDKLDDSDRNWQEHYNALKAIAGEKLQAISVDWASVRDKSKEALSEVADKALATYDAMVFSSLHFSREVLDEQLQKVRETRDAARGMGAEFIAAHAAAEAAAKKQEEELKAVEKAAKAATEAARQLGGAFEVTAANIEQTATMMRMNLSDVLDLARKGFSFAEIVGVIQGQIPRNAAPRGPRIQGFAEGGVVDIMTGENGPEVARMPIGTTIFPHGTVPPGAGGSAGVTQVFYVNGTGADVARVASRELMRTLKQIRQFGSA